MSGVSPGNILQSIERKKSSSQFGLRGNDVVQSRFKGELDPLAEAAVESSIHESMLMGSHNFGSGKRHSIDGSKVAPLPKGTEEARKRRPSANMADREKETSESFHAREFSNSLTASEKIKLHKQANNKQEEHRPVGAVEEEEEEKKAQDGYEHAVEDDFCPYESADKVSELTGSSTPTPRSIEEERHLATIRRWRKLKVATRTMNALSRLEDDIKIYGANVNVDDDEDKTSKLYSRQEYKDAKWYLLFPNNRFRRLWELLIVISLMHIVIVLPIRTCFSVESDETSEAIDLIVDVLFILDVFVNCISTYHDSNGELVINQKQILIHYARTWMAFDIVASIPLYKLLNLEESYDGGDAQINKLSKIARLPKLFRLIKLLRLLKLLRVVKLLRYFNQWERQNLGINIQFTRIFKVSFIVFMVVHLVSCLWFLMSWVGFEETPPDSWVFRHNIQDSDPMSQYLTSIYWSFSTLTTVGFGDISARTNQERIFSILTMIIGISWYSFIISTISSIVSSLDRKNALNKRKQRLIMEFMRQTKVPWQLRKRILKYFDYVTSLETIETDQKEMESVLSILSSQLRTELTLHVHRNLIPQIPFFYNKTPQFIAACASLLRPLQFQSGDYITTRKQHADEVYFLTSGRAHVVLPNGKVFRTIVEGSYFGEIACILSETHRVSIKAGTICKIYSLSKSDLKQLMGDYPDVANEIRTTAKKRIEHLNSRTQTEDVRKRQQENVFTSFPGAAFDEVPYERQNSTQSEMGESVAESISGTQKSYDSLFNVISETETDNFDDEPRQSNQSASSEETRKQMETILIELQTAKQERRKMLATMQRMEAMILHLETQIMPQQNNNK